MKSTCRTCRFRSKARVISSADSTPLMSGSNAISGITLIGALLSAGSQRTELAVWLGLAAVVLATVNVVGGFLVTHRMLGMFKRRS